MRPRLAVVAVPRANPVRASSARPRRTRERAWDHSETVRPVLTTVEINVVLEVLDDPAGWCSPHRQLGA